MSEQEQTTAMDNLTVTEADLPEPKKNPHRENLVPIEFSHFTLWTANYNHVYPFATLRDLNDEAEVMDNQVAMEQWWKDAFRELLEIDELDKVYRRLISVNAAAGHLFQLEPKGKFRFLTGQEITERRRRLKATLAFIANYSGNARWYSDLVQFDAGNVTLADLLEEEND